MKKFQTLIILAVVVALAGVGAASASATLWLKNGVSLTKEEAATWHGTVTLWHSGGTGNSKVECSVLLVGTVGPGAKDKITLIENLTGTQKDLITCKTLEGCFVSEPTKHFVNLPWTTELVLEGGVTWDKVTAAGSGPGAELECVFGIKVTCTGPVKLKFNKNGANGAEFSYEGIASGEQGCSDGGKNTVGGTVVVLGFTVS